MNTKIYLEGGGDSKELHTRCREGFRRLLEKCGFHGRMPRLVACGSRSNVLDTFATALSNAPAGAYFAMLVDSEAVVVDPEMTWAHLKGRDGWDPPQDATNENVLFMTTCMETWIVADRVTIREHFGASFQDSALPALNSLESKRSSEVQAALAHASRECKNSYKKGARSFELVGKLNPASLRQHLASFVRVERILKKHL